MPIARQLCAGSNRQLMIDVEKKVECPECLLPFSSFDRVRNRDRMHPIVPSHLPDPAGRGKVELSRLKRRREGTPAPW